ncbi:aldehyde dehydrogenase (NADP(+)) [Sediminibacterium sp.]|uniref:aldehyde dehydrogenase (NADP(+)) n=1 Tax=Sediminibacterium sp. TaxID=1917865 RepID=UPI003F72058F
MLHGHNLIGFEESAKGKETFQSFSTVQGSFLPDQFHIATNNEIEAAIAKAVAAFGIYSKLSFAERAVFLETIAEEILQLGDDLLERAHLESGLPLARLTGERDRTMNQLKLFASLLREGSWADAVIDTAMPDRQPLPRADLRRILQPLGPVTVFAASNFPFAFSTAGGDTASALASGCPVIVKAHSAHAGTNELMATAIKRAAEKTGMPDGVFSSLNGEGATLGQRLAVDPSIKAIGFTGSYRAGMALYETVTQKRKAPIPLYAEMSSINPVVLLPETLALKTAAIANTLAGSITLGVGQFCTNPGLILVIKSKATEAFIELMTASLSAVVAGTMLNDSICKAYYTDRNKLINNQQVQIIFKGTELANEYKGTPALFSVTAKEFIANPALQNEVFGPSSLVVICDDKMQLETALTQLHGQLTGTVFGSNEELLRYTTVVQLLQEKTGRVIFNSAPTGVEVCHAMVHGGPFPATTDSRTTSVGTEAIRRFVRPVCYQDCPEALLPLYLQNKNHAGIMRKINGNYSRDSI